jgi:aspartate racemase
MQDDTAKPSTSRTIGLVGGLGVAAGIHYYHLLIKNYEARRQTLNLLIAHASAERAVGFVRGGDIGGLANYLAAFIQSLAAGGAQLAVVPAVTPHICIDQLSALCPIPIISILEAIREDFKRRDGTRVALMGSRYVIETNMYGALNGFDVIRPSSDEVNTIDRIYQKLATSGSVTTEERDALDTLGNTLYQREHLDGILVVGTDLSPVFDTAPPPFPIIDCSHIHVASVVAAAREQNVVGPVGFEPTRNQL